MKLRRRENAGRSNHIAFHQAVQSGIVFFRMLLTGKYSMYMLYQ